MLPSNVENNKYDFTNVLLISSQPHMCLLIWGCVYGVLFNKGKDGTLNDCKKDGEVR